MIQCEKGHFFDDNRYSSCPYCNQTSNRPRSIKPPVAPNMEIPKPSCGKTVAIEGMDVGPAVGKTVAIDNFEEQEVHINKTVAIDPEISTGLPSMANLEPAPMPVVAPVSDPQMQPAPMPVVAPAESPMQAVPMPEVQPSAPQIPQPEAGFIPTPVENAPVVPAASESPVNNGYDQDINAEIPYTGMSEEPERVLTEQFDVDLKDRPYAVTGLGVKENPQPLPPQENYLPTDRPYAVSGLGVYSNPKPISAEDAVTIPIPPADNAGAAAAQPGQAEAAAFAAFGFPGGPMPGMMPGMGMPGVPMPGAPMPGAPVPVETPAENPAETIVSGVPVTESTPEDVAEVDPVVAETISVERPVEAPEVPSESETPLHEQICKVNTVEETTDNSNDILTPQQNVFVPAAQPVATPEPPKPVDPNATVAMTESDMDYLPRVHARAFLVCIDGPMTGASFVFQENKAVIGRQKNYEIALFRDNSVSRSQHAIIRYDKDYLKYTIEPGEADKIVTVNGFQINQPYVLGLYDIIGIGQSRLLFIPVCSEKFAW